MCRSQLDAQVEDRIAGRTSPQLQIDTAGGWSLKLDARPKAAGNRGNPMIGSSALAPRSAALPIPDNSSERRSTRSAAITAMSTLHCCLQSPVRLLATPTRRSSKVLYRTDAVEVDVATGEAASIRRSDGFFIGDCATANTRIAGLLVASRVMPWSVGRIWPRLWPSGGAAVSRSMDQSRRITDGF
jgi:hypothetical protein